MKIYKARMVDNAIVDLRRGYTQLSRINRLQTGSYLIFEQSTGSTPNSFEQTSHAQFYNTRQIRLNYGFKRCRISEC